MIQNFSAELNVTVAFVHHSLPREVRETGTQGQGAATDGCRTAFFEKFRTFFLREDCKKRKSCTSGESIVGSSPLAITSQRQSTMEEMIPKMDKSTWEKSLRDLFIKNNISFNVVQSDAFINFVKCTARYGPSVPISSYETLRGRIIPEARKDLEKYAEEVKFSWKQTGCTFMSDSWTDLKKRSFLNVIAYSPGGALFLKSEECSHAKLTAFYIFDILEKEIESIGPNLVVQLISDNASNYSSALDMLTGKYRWLFKTRCAAHGINLMLKDIYEKWKRSLDS
ncbi:uncharacterized protein LOC122061717 [Macadamia integrifolia]|uniref:uncharacterized protein LOC122061717 n=1 Tax=Macadamia integrifolia TaxID=60698 RepID=UPI001C531B23|nr:uncharacterized protein LOC122061717 [Macadamia integrifolia]